MCPHEPEDDCGHTNQIMTAHVKCVTGPVTVNHVYCTHIYLKGRGDMAKTFISSSLY